MPGTLAIIWVLFIVFGEVACLIWGPWYSWLALPPLLFVAYQVLWPAVKTPWD